MESSQLGSEESQNQVVLVAFSIGHGVIKPLALIPLQTCILSVAYMQPVLLIHELNKTEKISNCS